jgi:peptide/nickel transport system ATP-binding protein
VMYAGRVVECAEVRSLFARPEHPYTQGLLACLPGKARRPGEPKPKRLFAIRGQVSSPLRPPPGCAFEPRCDRAVAACRDSMPALVDTAAGRQARCLLVAPAATTQEAA